MDGYIVLLTLEIINIADFDSGCLRFGFAEVYLLIVYVLLQGILQSGFPISGKKGLNICKRVCLQVFAGHLRIPFLAVFLGSGWYFACFICTVP